jgi:hypothetical protein
MAAPAPMPPTPSLARGVLGGLFAACSLGVSMGWLWGFTVDDALISCRVASNLAQGLGYRFNPTGPVVDAVTPLGWGQLLSWFAQSGPLSALQAAKWLGALAVALAVFGLGRRIAGRASTAYAGALSLCLAVTAPVAAWAVAGMETGVVTALAIAALGGGLAADLAAALAAAWRPELAPWCAAIRLGLRLAAGMKLGRALASPAIVLGAVALVGALRSLYFGRAAPLAMFAKPSDFEHGISYAAHAFVQCGLPLLCVAPWALRRASGVARAVAAAGVAHFAALVLAGGDWMTLYRLAAPVLPSFVLGAAELWRVAPAWSSWLRLGLALLMSVYLAQALGPVARQVGPDRARVIERARSPLSGARSVAALDIGWLGAATEASIVDLAGVTDEVVAMLPGGHTSKRIDDALLRNREVDALVLLREGRGDGFCQRDDYGYAREVEHRVARLPSVSDFRVAARLPFSGGQRCYVVLRKP